jgi:hypothetical protein
MKSATNYADQSTEYGRLADRTLFSPQLSQRIPSWSPHYSRMDWVIIGVAVVLGLMLAVLSLDGEYRYRQTPENDRDRSAEREEHWYALDEPMIIEKNPTEGPLR